MKLFNLMFLWCGSLAVYGQSPDVKNLRAAADYLASRNGHAMLVYHKNELIFEEYFNGHSEDKPHRLASGTKSFSGVMAAAAVDDKLLTWDEPVADTITEWKDDPRLSRITVRQLLGLTSGMDAGRVGKVPGYVEAISSHAKREPGSTFQYGPAPFQVFGELMKRKLDDKHPLEYLEERIFEPIGLNYAFWRKGKDGNPHLPSGAALTAKEWAKFGLLVLDGGRDVISKNNLSQCFKGSKAMRSYGITFWLGDGTRLPKGVISAAGAGKQKLYIFPERDLLVVQFAESINFKENEFWNILLGRPEKGEGDMERRRMFTQRDTNGDGVITANEVRSPLIFKVIDADRDGKVTPKELEAYIKRRERR